jgi:hypothetical protein
MAGSGTPKPTAGNYDKERPRATAETMTTPAAAGKTGAMEFFFVITGFQSRPEANSIEGKWKSIVTHAQTSARGTIKSDAKSFLMAKYLAEQPSFKHLTMTNCARLSDNIAQYTTK